MEVRKCQWFLLSSCLLVFFARKLWAIESTDPKVIRSVPGPYWAIANAKESDLVYTYFKDGSDKSGTVVTRETVDKVIVDKTKKTIFITHGFSADDTDPWFPEMRDKYFSRGEHNVIFLNWKVPANQFLLISLANVKPVSEYVGKFFVSSGIPPEKIHLIGHSLGGQLVGHIGKYIKKTTNKQVARITGLDPAAPGYEYPDNMTNNDRLYKTDAKFVDIIHTNIKLYGYTEPIGHVDFYPNYGEHQPGCPTNASGNLHCSHARAPYYFAESITKRVRAITCSLKKRTPDDKYDLYVVPKPKGQVVIFGEQVDQIKRGIFFLKTNPKEPYLKLNSI